MDSETVNWDEDVAPETLTIDELAQECALAETKRDEAKSAVTAAELKLSSAVTQLICYRSRLTAAVRNLVATKRKS